MLKKIYSSPVHRRLCHLAVQFVPGAILVFGGIVACAAFAQSATTKPQAH